MGPEKNAICRERPSTKAAIHCVSSEPHNVSHPNLEFTNPTTPTAPPKKVKAKEIDVLGSLQGNVDGADKIYIRNGAHFVGDIQALGIVIEDGGFIRGKVDLSRKSSAVA